MVENSEKIYFDEINEVINDYRLDKYNIKDGCSSNELLLKAYKNGEEFSCNIFKISKFHFHPKILELIKQINPNCFLPIKEYHYYNGLLYVIRPIYKNLDVKQFKKNIKEIINVYFDCICFCYQNNYCQYISDITKTLVIYNEKLYIGSLYCIKEKKSIEKIFYITLKLAGFIKDNIDKEIGSKLLIIINDDYDGGLRELFLNEF